MGDNKNKTKTKAAMLNELESIKGLLLEEDDIPILQEIIENKPEPVAPTLTPKSSPADSPKAAVKTAPEPRTIFEDQQDFFNSPTSMPIHQATKSEPSQPSLDSINEPEKHIAEVATNKLVGDANKAASRPTSLAKATGENPFLPEHIRARLHGNNPPPLFETETARKIATSSIPTRQLGNTFSISGTSFGNVNSHHQDIIDSIIDKMMPEIEKELRNRLEIMTKNLLDEFNK